MELRPEPIIALVLGVAAIFAAGIRSRRWPKEDPTLQQWANRLIEHVDAQYLPLAFNRFSYLVQSGLEPEHAFEITIRG